MNIQTIMAMIPGAEDFKRQGLELIAAANKLTTCADEVASARDGYLSQTVGPNYVVAKIDAMEIANAEFKQALAVLPPLPGV